MKTLLLILLSFVSILSNAQTKIMDDTIKYYYLTPDKVSGEEFRQLVELIHDGGENTKENILPKLKQAKEIAFAKSGKEIISTLTIKQPLDTIRKDIFERAKSTFSYKEYILETGFWATKKDFQNKGVFKTMLNAQMIKFKNEKMYCILNNEDGISLLTKNYGFKLNGNSFISKKSGHVYNLLVKE